MSEHAGDPAQSEAPVSDSRFRPELRFVLFFALFAALFELVFVAWIQHSAWFEGYLAWSADAAAFLLRLIGIAATSEGRTLLTGARGIELLRGCDAVEPTGLYLTALVLFPATWPEKLRGACVGVLALNALNLVRILSLALVQIHRPRAFQTLHVTVWPVIFLLVALALWIGWALRLRSAARA